MLDRIRLILFTFDEGIINEEELSSVLGLYINLTDAQREEIVYPRHTARLDGGPDTNGLNLYC